MQVCQAWVSIGLLRQQLLGTDRIHGIITDGGTAVSLQSIISKTRNKKRKKKVTIVNIRI